MSQENSLSHRSHLYPVNVGTGLPNLAHFFSKETQNPVFVQAQFVPADFTFKLATVGYARARPGSWRVCPC